MVTITDIDLPPVHDSNGNEETTGESSHCWYDWRETERYFRDGTDEGNEKSYPGLVQSNVDEDDLKEHKDIIGFMIDQL